VTASQHREPGAAGQADDGRLSEHVPVRFPAELIAAAKQRADAEGMTVSAWIRREVEREVSRRTVPGQAASAPAAAQAATDAKTPGQAAPAPDEIPDAYARYIRATFPPEVLASAPNEIAGRWKHMTGPAERKFWHSLDEVRAVAVRAIDIAEQLWEETPPDLRPEIDFAAMRQRAEGSTS
jgi:hypothetical protein